MHVVQRALHAHLVLSSLCLTLGSGAAHAYDMLDYMRHDNTSKANVLTITRGGTGEQIIRDYDIVPGSRFYITKNWNGATGATEFEEYSYDNNFIYLVRDTSWEAGNWCPGGIDTSFELWTNGVNWGAWIPRYVNSGQSYTTGPFELRARHDGNDCATCRSSFDTGGQQNLTRTILVTHHATAPFNSALADVIELTVTGGAGAGEHYFFSKTLGWVGYTSSSVSSYYSKLANNGNAFEVQVIDVCPIKNPDIEATSQAQYGTVYYFGPNGAWAYHANYRKDGSDGLQFKFGYYSAGTSETVGQVLNLRFVAGKTYIFTSYAQGGGDNTGTLPYEIGYAATDDNYSSYSMLARVPRAVVGTSWARTDGVTYKAPASGAMIGKQVVVRFASGGASDIWYDNLSLTVSP